MNYLLDTNACIALINRTSAAVRNRFQKALSARAQIYVSSVVTFELWYGVAKSERQDLNTQRLQAFLAGPMILLPLEEQDARVAGWIRAVLQASGTPIDAYDTLIAGQAMARQLTLVTANVSEFSRVKGLTWQDWARV
ncbi:MAG: type II toxin-antitoxin system VapC family toxin [Candidatus Sulfotelmatobacter sp.]